MRSSLPITSFVALVALAAVVALALVPWSGVAEKPVALAALVVIALIIGARPVRIAKLKVDLVVMELFLFTALLALAPAAAPLVAVASVCGAMFGPRRRPFSIRTVFNIASIALSAALAAIVFDGMLNAHQPAPGGYALPLVAAGMVFLLTNTGLASVVVSIHSGYSFFRVWTRCCTLSVTPTVTGAVLGAGISSLVIATGPAVLIVGLIVSLPLTAYDRMQALGLDHAAHPCGAAPSAPSFETAGVESAFRDIDPSVEPDESPPVPAPDDRVRVP